MSTKLKDGSCYFDVDPLTEENACQIARIIKTMVSGKRIAKLENGVYRIFKDGIEWTLSVPATRHNSSVTCWKLSVKITDEQSEISPHLFAIKSIVALFKIYHLDTIVRDVELTKKCTILG
jgi:hypothetical protein